MGLPPLYPSAGSFIPFGQQPPPPSQSPTSPDDIETVSDEADGSEDTNNNNGEVEGDAADESPSKQTENDSEAVDSA